jgi:putative spermidine/putrescine transport system ATP-binding protein
VNLRIAEGETIALLGPSGCGKTTLLRIVAGFVRPTAGEIAVDGRAITALPPAERNVGLVFQSYALFPHLKVRDNVAYGLRARGAPRQLVRERVERMLALVKMDAMADRYPAQLSGGQQQRVAIARALATEPRLMLLDEPFSALDRGLRLDMQLEIKRLLAAQRMTAIIVTHDQEEALSMADRVVVLRDGRIEQVDTPTRLYDRPATLFVNRFIGQTNLLGGTMVRAGDEAAIVELDHLGRIALEPAADRVAGERVWVSIRPENLVEDDGTDPADGTLRIVAVARTVLPLGPVDVVEAETDGGGSLKFTRPHRWGTGAIAPGDRLRLRIAAPAACRIFGARDADGEANRPPAPTVRGAADPQPRRPSDPSPASPALVHTA